MSYRLDLNKVVPRESRVAFYRYLGTGSHKNCESCNEKAELGQYICWRCDAVFHPTRIDVEKRFINLLEVR